MMIDTVHIGAGSYPEEPQELQEPQLHDELEVQELQEYLADEYYEIKRLEEME